MCRILGIKNFDYRKHKELVENFFQLAEIGKTLKGDTKGHTDGWGIGCYESGKAVVWRSDKSVIKERDVFFKTIKNIKSSKVLIVHFRKSAWENTNSPENSHPFQYKNILFAHNGTIYDYKKLLKNITPKNEPSPNVLDSEVYFRYLMNSLSSDIEQTFKNSVAQIKKKNKYSSLTCIFTDGNTLYAYREYTKSPNYYTLYHSQIGNSSIISSEPISSKLNWQILRKNKLFTF